MSGDMILSKDGKWYTEDERPGLFKDFRKRVQELETIRNERDPELTAVASEEPLIVQPITWQDEQLEVYCED